MGTDNTGISTYLQGAVVTFWHEFEGWPTPIIVSIENEPWYPFTPALAPYESRLRHEWEMVKPKIVEKIIACSKAVALAQEAQDRPRVVAVELDQIGSAWTGESALAAQSLLAARSVESTSYLSGFQAWAADAGDKYWDLYREALDEIARIDGLAPPREARRAAHERAKALAAARGGDVHQASGNSYASGTRQRYLAGQD